MALGCRGSPTFAAKLGSVAYLDTRLPTLPVYFVAVKVPRSVELWSYDSKISTNAVKKLWSFRIFRYYLICLACIQMYSACATELWHWKVKPLRRLAMTCHDLPAKTWPVTSSTKAPRKARDAADAMALLTLLSKSEALILIESHRVSSSMELLSGAALQAKWQAFPT